MVEFSIILPLPYYGYINLGYFKYFTHLNAYGFNHYFVDQVHPLLRKSDG